MPYVSAKSDSRLMMLILPHSTVHAMSRLPVIADRVHDKTLRFLRLLGVELAHASALPES
jgi:hypothetical protein